MTPRGLFVENFMLLARSACVLKSLFFCYKIAHFPKKPSS